MHHMLCVLRCVAYIDRETGAIDKSEPSRLGLQCFTQACVIRLMLLQVHHSNVTKPILFSICSYHIALLCKTLNIDFLVLPQNSIFALIMVATWIL